jgi:hypothetical protein
MNADSGLNALLEPFFGLSPMRAADFVAYFKKL